MPLENLEEEGLEKNPNLELAQIKFNLSQPEHKSDISLQQKLMDAIIKDSEFFNFANILQLKSLIFYHFFFNTFYFIDFWLSNWNSMFAVSDITKLLMFNHFHSRIIFKFQNISF